LLLGGPIGFAEAYLDGDWETADLTALLGLALANEAPLRGSVRGTGAIRLANRLHHLFRLNTRSGSRRNIAAHYDLGNDFYRLWLDPEMSYSAGLFATGTESLEAAQEAKYRLLLRLLEPTPGQSLLEIGCGWGAFARMAAREHGCRVRALTLSSAQAAIARARVEAEGLDDRVAIRLQDYRDADGVYDRIASVEMFEAVGEAYWPLFFEKLWERLRPGGIAALQIITIDAARFDTYRRGADFIQRHVFPGGMLPSLPALERQIAAAGLRLTERVAFGGSYARTLALWRERFLAAWPAIARLGFDERFRRLWQYYLSYCEAGFRAGSIDVAQYRIEKAGSWR
jgi:cyclopropane-fatty-acyl-phospholipid synthase